jgi:transposase
MYDVPDIHAIRVLSQRGFSKRGIARMLGISRKTVDKYVDPAYVVPTKVQMHLSRPRPAPKLDPWKPVIDTWLAEDEQVPRKQRRTARKIYQELKARGADVAEVTVRQYVARVKGARAQQAFVPLEFPMGEMAQADFGHAVVILGDQQRQVPFFVCRLMASTLSFVKAYRDEKLEAFLDGMVSALSFSGGVPAKMMFDNASTLVQKILAGGKRVQTPEFKALQAHYGFEAVFANPGRGNEKGGAENLVQWAQRNLFSPVPRAGCLDELNQILLDKCLLEARTRRRGGDGPLVADLWDKELAHLAPLPAKPFPACRNRFVRVDKCLLVDYDRAHYSAPAAYAGKSLLLRAFWDRIELVDQGRVVAVHERKVPGESSLQLAHYLPVLVRKPHAVSHAAVIARGAPAIARYRDEFLTARPEAYREMVAILRLSETAGLDRLTAALAVASTHHAYDITSVEAILAMDRPVQQPPELPEQVLARWPQAEVAPVDAAVYAWHTDGMTGGVLA